MEQAVGPKAEGDLLPAQGAVEIGHVSLSEAEEEGGYIQADTD